MRWRVHVQALATHVARDQDPQLAKQTDRRMALQEGMDEAGIVVETLGQPVEAEGAVNSGRLSPPSPRIPDGSLLKLRKQLVPEIIRVKMAAVDAYAS
jgi:hypothetical protein